MSLGLFTTEMTSGPREPLKGVKVVLLVEVVDVQRLLKLLPCGAAGVSAFAFRSFLHKVILFTVAELVELPPLLLVEEEELFVIIIRFEFVEFELGLVVCCC